MTLMQNQARKVIIDCDPGQDDAIALLLAFGASDKMDLIGVTTVGGNVGIDLTQRNARIVCEFAGIKDIPVFAGCSRPLVRDPIVADYYHGITGLGGFEIFEPTVPLQKEHAVNFLVARLLSEADHSVTLACLAPLTNIAMALVMAPEIRTKIKQIVFMGGAQREGGNTTPTSSFNVFCDPHAAHVVLSSGIPVVMVNLDVTHQIVMTKERLSKIEKMESRVSRAVHNMLTWDHARRMSNFSAGAAGLPVSDMSVIAYILNSSLFSGRELNVSVDLVSPLTTGMTVVDVWGFTDRKPNALWLQSVDAEGVFGLLLNSLKRLQ